MSLATLAFVVGWEACGLDMALAGWWGSASGFAARDAWWSRHLLHDGGRWLAGLALLACAAFAWFGGARPAQVRRTRLAWLLAVFAGLVLVPALKRLSQSSCPWDLAAFGGSAAYVPHWMWATIDGGPGHCFPSGHAVAAFAFLPLYFQWRAHRPALARWILGSVLIAGALFGWAQLARGAHFPSHTLWSAWLCWVMGCIAARALERDDGRHASDRPTAVHAAGACSSAS
ncbi:MAG TPA: phosphatase PAP2 family protein [Gammaproteobacteria bacterium]